MNIVSKRLATISAKLREKNTSVWKKKQEQHVQYVAKMYTVQYVYLLSFGPVVRKYDCTLGFSLVRLVSENT